MYFDVLFCRFAAKIILFALNYKKKIDSNELPPDTIPSRGGKSTPLCMDTYHHFFPAYRRPGEQKDELVMSHQQDDKHAWHVVVACKNQVRITFDVTSSCHSVIERITQILETKMTRKSYCLMVEKIYLSPVERNREEYETRNFFFQNNDLLRVQGKSSLYCHRAANEKRPSLRATTSGLLLLAVSPQPFFRIGAPSKTEHANIPPGL
ncbi:choline O-acetyltransferase [Trichonephila inaurata madagascariensis]|uniref:Choline O-acetyltransferase n=1 Tax=Trichonephila inaurata madagascariensis TaxID=2747483 RepID=A0A8X7CM35_9ARAC|nr:choline O-acetyltransferase [Trichonephila inaurata madagascariensis]